MATQSSVPGDRVLVVGVDQGAVDGEWLQHGRLHREDGPAVIPDGRRVWFIEGQKVREERKSRSGM